MFQIISVYFPHDPNNLQVVKVKFVWSQTIIWTHFLLAQILNE